MFNFDSDIGDASGVGQLDFEYSYTAFNKLKAFLNYGFIFKGTTNLGSSVNNFSLGGLYCVFGCTNEKVSSNGLERTTQSLWTLELGAGFATKSFQLANSKLSLSGMVYRVDVTYFLTEEYRLVLTNKFEFLSNSTQNLNAQSSGFGAQYLF
jgi:hypothetical protein